MPTIRLAAGAAVSLLLLALCALLAGPSFELPGAAPDGGIGAGALPRFVVVAVAVLAVAVFVQQVMAARAGRVVHADDGADEADPRRVLGLGAGVLVLLAGYAYGWTVAGFLPATIAFILALGLLLVPAESRTPRGLLVIAATAVLFSLGVWGLFVHILAVPLR